MNKKVMTKKEQQRQVTKRFMNKVGEIYGLVIDEEGESGTIDFAIDVRDSNGDAFDFNYRRSYQDVGCWKMKGDVDYKKGFDLECELQSILSKIVNEVEMEAQNG